jgi:hypothetical protein
MRFPERNHYFALRREKQQGVTGKSVVGRQASVVTRETPLFSSADEHGFARILRLSAFICGTEVDLRAGGKSKPDD